MKRPTWLKHPSVLAITLAVLTALVSFALAERQISASERALRLTLSQQADSQRRDLREQDVAQRASFESQLAAERRQIDRDGRARRRDDRRVAYIAYSAASGRFLGCLDRSCGDRGLRKADTDVFTAEEQLQFLGSDEAIEKAEEVTSIVRRLLNAELGDDRLQQRRLFFRLQGAMRAFTQTAKADLAE
jgi:hypothetical protein